MTVLKALALAIALATSASTISEPIGQGRIQHDPIDATWAQELV